MAILLTETKGTDAVALIKHAIENKYECSFWYYGVKFRDPNNHQYTKANWRFVQPVALGRSAATGKLMVRAWQKQGITNTVKPMWKTFLIDEIRPGTITVFDGKDGVYYRPFDDPDGFDYNDNGDMKMEMGTPLVKIDLKAPPGPNLGLKPKKEKKPTDKPTATMKADKEFKKRAPNPNTKKEKPELDPTEPVAQGPQKPIHKPEGEDSIQSHIIKTKNGNPNDPKPKPDQPKPDQGQNKQPDPQVPAPGEEEDQEQINK